MAVGVGDSDSGLPWGVALSLTLRFWVAVSIYEKSWVCDGYGFEWICCCWSVTDVGVVIWISGLQFGSGWWVAICY